MITRLDLHGCLLARGGPDGSLTVYHLTARSLLWRKLAHTGKLTALDWKPDGTVLASGGDDGQIHLWSAFTGEQLATFTHQCAVQYLRWSWDGCQLAATNGSEISLWEPPLTVAPPPALPC